MVPTELLVTAMVGGFVVALSAVLAMAGVLGSRIGDVRGDLSDVRADLRDVRAEVNGRFDGLEVRFAAIDHRIGALTDEFVTVRVSLGVIDSRLSALER